MEDPQQIYAQIIEIKEEPTALYKILKIAGVVSGGGEAKFAISEGYVFLNGKVEPKKRKKIYAGDLIFFDDKYLKIAIIGKSTASNFVNKVDIKKSNDMKETKTTVRPAIRFY
ncbi:MAG: RNA-binding S4 domain-containing protein [Psychromonas sp.]|nr:RNA-binding S4 domain-containing protein [Psychromonas sp.]